MRSTLIIIIGFLILIGGSWLLVDKIDYTSENILIELKQAENLLKSNKFDEALSIINNNYKYWKSLTSWYAILLNHTTLKNIEISYLKLQQYIYYKDISMSLAELKTLQLLIKDIPESESFKIYNIL